MKENIWGKEGCELPGGGLCTACCVLPDIELEGSIVSVGKPENTPCPNLDLVNGGCKLHLNAKPDTCRNWDCSKTDINGKLWLIAGGLALELVNSDQAVISALNLINSDADKLRAQIEKNAKNLANDIKPRDLICRDLVEP